MTRRRAALEDAELLKLLYYLRLSRAFEERLSILIRQGKVVGGVFSDIGQEAITVGACFNLRQQDFICPLHRDLGALLVKGVPAKVLMAAGRLCLSLARRTLWPRPPAGGPFTWCADCLRRPRERRRVSLSGVEFHYEAPAGIWVRYGETALCLACARGREVGS